MTVRHSRGSYPIRFRTLAEALADLPTPCAVITDSEIVRLYGSALQDVPHFAIPHGEGSKNLEVYSSVIRWLASVPLPRSGTVVALGGGVVGDLAGFAAGTYMRGVRLLQIPTTLLAMVDSSVGGKVGVDLPEGKNLVGAFVPPDAVDVPVETLGTLPPRQFINGMAEVCKYGFIMDRGLHRRLGEHRLSPDDPGLAALIQTCIEHKAAVVEADEFERTGLRATLNFGHTVGHAIEQVTGYGPILHGEAIAVGMRAEAQIAEHLGLAPAGTAAEIERVLQLQGLPTQTGRALDPHRLVEAMRKDKKASVAGIAMALVTDIGECKLVEGIPPASIEPFLNHL